MKGHPMGVGFDYSLYFLKQAAGAWTERANFGVQSIFLRTPFQDNFRIADNSVQDEPISTGVG